LANVPTRGSFSDKDELWQILVETAHAMPMYNSHKRYVSEVIMKDKPDISPKELAVTINITRGEAMVILEEITSENRGSGKIVDQRRTAPQGDRKLFDFN